MSGTAAPDAAGGDALRVTGLTLDYEIEHGVVRAVDGIDLALKPGERLVLLGPSGCGKSSILKAIAGFIEPSAGMVEVRGRRVAGPGPDRLVVFQEFDQLLPWKTIRQNVMFPLRVARRMSRAQASAKAAAALAKVGLERVTDHYPHTLSGGMKQRAAIARAVAAEADILLMDEPFAALDAFTRTRLQDDLLTLAQDSGITLVFVTHAIDEAVLIGTTLHVLSAHPGRTVAVFDTSGFGRADINGPTFAAMVQQIGDLVGTEPARQAA